MSDITTGIDIGTHHIKVVIAAAPDDRRMMPRILGTGYAQSLGVKRGYIVSIEEASRSIAAAVNQAAKAARIKKLRRAIVAIGGEGLHELHSRAEIVVERGDAEVTERDMERALAASESSLPPSMLLNRKIIHAIPQRYTLDGTRFLGKNPAGSRAARVGLESLFVAAEKRHVNDVAEALGIAGIEIEDMAAAPLAASFVTLGKQQKRAGVALLDIGAETASLIVFDDDIPVSTLVLPLGSDDISGDIALALKIPLEEAAQLKSGVVLGGDYPQRKVDEAIEKRLAIIFRAIDAHLKKLGKDGLLPAGIILTGGGSQIAAAPLVAQKILKLPARVAAIQSSDGGRGQLKDGSWSVAYGLTVWGLSNRNDFELAGNSPGIMRDLFGSAWSFVKKFLP
jgi:cell division protein FtsA